MVVLLGIALLAAAPAAGQHPATTDAAERSADPRDKIICKRFVETGSLVRGYRSCKTKAEWDRERDNIRAPGNPGLCVPRDNGTGC